MTVIRFEELYENAACGLLSLDAFDRVTTANETFLGWSGNEDDPLVGILGRPFTELLVTSSRLFYETRCQPVLRLEGEIREVALSLERARGGPLPVLINAVLIRDDAGNAVETRIAVFDSTRRQDYEHELLGARRAAESSETRVRVLQNASTLFLATEDEDSLAAALAETAREALSAADAAVVLFDADGAPRVAAGTHLSTILDVLPRPSALLTVSSLEDAAALSPAVADILSGSRFRAFSSVPLHDGSSILGGLYCFFGREREIDQASGELLEALARQASLVVVRTRLQAELRQLAMHDQLTGLANRNLLRERLSHAVAASARSRQPMSLIFLDLDGFKTINDELGHRIGDVVLQTVAERIGAIIREADIVGRFGGDEFLVVCDDADEGAAAKVSERILREVRKQLVGPLVGRSVTASIGIVTLHPADGESPTNDALVRAADAAMYRSKTAGGDRATLVTL